MASATTTDERDGLGYPAALVWCGAVLFGVGAGTAAALLQRWFAPIGVFPLAVGVIAGLGPTGYRLALRYALEQPAAPR